jgi:hypothetical protein
MLPAALILGLIAAARGVGGPAWCSMLVLALVRLRRACRCPKSAAVAAELFWSRFTVSWSQALPAP